MNNEVIFGITCSGGMLLLSLFQMMLYLKNFRQQIPEQLVILNQGLLWQNRGPGWGRSFANVYFPWTSIERIDWQAGTPQQKESLFITTHNSLWYSTITLKNLRPQDREQFLNLVAENVSVERHYCSFV